MPKRNTSINLTESALQMADAMAQEYGVSRAAIIELAVRVLFKNRDEFLKLSAKDDRSNNQP
jgi:metal-responsive CopG/Arc/MetJ family transcriptional regulator